MRLRNLLIVLALVIRELVIRRGRRYGHLLLAFEAKQVIHLVHSQALGIVDEEEGIDARADQCCSKKHVYTPLHTRVHLRQRLGNYQGPDPDGSGGKWARNGAQ